MASLVASTSRQAIRNFSRVRAFSTELGALRNAAGPGLNSSSTSEKSKGKQRDDFLEEAASRPKVLHQLHPETQSHQNQPDPEVTPNTKAPVQAQGAQPPTGGTPPESSHSDEQHHHHQQQHSEEEEQNVDALPVQQIMSSDIEPPHKIPGGSPSATELMSLEPFSHAHHRRDHHSHSHGDHHQQGSMDGLPMPMPHAILDGLHLRHPFNTHNFVAALEASSFDRHVSEAFMRATKSILVSEEEHSLSNLVGKQDLENQAYLFRAALDELQTEVQVQSRNDAITLRSANSQLQREIDAFTQKLREDIHDLKNECVFLFIFVLELAADLSGTSSIQIDFNSRKEESTAEQKDLELKIIDLGNKFTVSLGEVRTELEAKKWLQTRRSLGGFHRSSHASGILVTDSTWSFLFFCSHD